jgi:hypothetical protein
MINIKRTSTSLRVYYPKRTYESMTQKPYFEMIYFGMSI